MNSQNEASEEAVLWTPPDRKGKRRTAWQRARRGLSGFVLAAGLLYLGWQLWMHHRSRPAPLWREWFQGVTYIRDVRRSPRPLVIHVVIIRLDTPGVGFAVTPGDPTRRLPLRARKTSAFLAEVGAQVAINTDFFYPWYSHNIFSYYPHVGDPVAVQGVSAANGIVYHPAGRETAPYPTLYLSHTHEAQFTLPNTPIFHALSGNRMLVDGGKIIAGNPRAKDKLDPRTAIGLDRTRQTLVLVTVDGRQPNYSEGVTQTELAEILQQYGVWQGMNLDGGGSSTLVMQANSHKPQVINCPIDNYIPNRERPVANHLGIFARPLP